MIADEATLSRLAALAQTGDRQAYSALLTAAQSRLRRYFARKIMPHQLDDLVQDTLLAVHRKLASYDPARPFMPWLAAIARYRWVDQLRLSYRAAEVGLDEDIAEEADEDGLARISLDRLFQTLPPGQVRAIELVRIEGRSVREAAAATGQSESLIKINIHRGLKRLTAMIEKA